MFCPQCRQEISRHFDPLTAARGASFFRARGVPEQTRPLINISPRAVLGGNTSLPINNTSVASHSTPNQTNGQSNHPAVTNGITPPIAVATNLGAMI